MASIAVSFAVLYLGNLLYGRFTVGEPLDKVFRQSPSVLSYTVLKRKPVTVVRVKLGDVPDLHETVSGLEDSAEEVLKGQDVKVVVEDSRDEALSDAYYSMHFHIQEALVTGRFSGMSAEVARLAKEAGLDRHRVFVGDSSVYVQLHLNGHYLYEVLPRPAEYRGSPTGV
ncbi:MAG: hypothetical protein ACM3WT_07925 [Bacillota bacterium]